MILLENYNADFERDGETHVIKIVFLTYNQNNLNAEMWGANEKGETFRLSNISGIRIYKIN